MRLFIAIPVSGVVADYAANLKNELAQGRPDVKWVAKDNYHLTLKFLGEVSPDLLETIKGRLSTVAQSCPSFNLRARGVGFFPNRNRPRVIWTGIQGEIEKAEFLGERIDVYLAELGFEPEKKRSFHLTLGRVRSESGLGDLQNRAASLSEGKQEISFAVGEFYLMESKLSPRGPAYTIAERFFLTG